MAANRAKLTRNQAVVLRILRGAGGSMAAYGVLEAARSSGLTAPPQVYRALDKLVGLGLVHRLESRNRFIACLERHDPPNQPVAFLICKKCEQVLELPVRSVAEELRLKAENAGFALADVHVEAAGECSACRASASGVIPH